MSKGLFRIAVLTVVAAIGFAAGRFSAVREEREVTRATVLEALAEPSLEVRLVRLAELVRQFDATSASEAGRALSEVISSTDNNDLRLILAAWARHDPRAAFDSVLAWPLESKRIVGAGVVAYEWSRREGGLEVREYVREIRQPGVADAALRGLVQGWAQSRDLAGLTDFIANEPRIDSREAWSESLVNSLLATGGIEAVTSWADSVARDSKNRFKQTAFKKALRQVSNRDPKAAALWYEKQASEPYTRRALAVIAGEWAEHDPKAALEWLLRQPDGRERRVALQRWMTRFTTTDYRAALEWMEGADLSDSLAILPAIFVGASLPDHPVEASRWVDRIPDEATRAVAAKEVELAWRRIDTAGAERWIAERGLISGAAEKASP